MPAGPRLAGFLAGLLIGTEVADALRLIEVQSLQVRKAPSWPRSWANFSLLQLYFHRNAWANLHLLGRPDTSHFSLQERQLERWVAAKSGKSKAKVKSRDQGRRAERLDKHRESGL